MFNLFGRKKCTPPSPAKAIEKLSETLQMLEKRENHLDKQVQLLKVQAKEYLGQNNKNRAIVCLKKSKILEKELESISGQKFNLEIQISSLAQAITNSETISAMRLGRETLIGLEANTDPDKVADTMDDISENISRLEEVTDTISKPIGLFVEEEELIAELDELSTETKQEKLCLPEVPKKPIKSNEEDELRELEALMNA